MAGLSWAVLVQAQRDGGGLSLGWVCSAVDRLGLTTTWWPGQLSEDSSDDRDFILCCPSSSGRLAPLLVYIMVEGFQGQQKGEPQRSSTLRSLLGAGLLLSQEPRQVTRAVKILEFKIDPSSQ